MLEKYRARSRLVLNRLILPVGVLVRCRSDWHRIDTIDRFGFIIQKKFGIDGHTLLSTPRMLQPSVASSPYLRVLTLSIVLLYLTSSHPGNAKIFTRCQLSKELMRYSFNRSTIGSCEFHIQNMFYMSSDSKKIRAYVCHVYFTFSL